MSISDPSLELLEDTCTLLSRYPEAAQILRGFSSHFDEESISILRDKLANTADWICGFQRHQSGPDLNLASELYSRAVMLLECYPDFSDIQKPLAVGAVRYLIFRVDAVPDRRGKSGLEDDRIVVNHVLTRLGLGAHAIPEYLATAVEQPNCNQQATKIPDTPGYLERKARWKRFKCR